MNGADIDAVLARHGQAVLVMLAGASGSTPREAGASMLIFDGGLLGTIGGGTLEHRAIERASGLVGPVLLEMPLGPSLDQCCGGHVSVALVPLTIRDLGRFDGPAALWPDGPRWYPEPLGRQIVIYGAGHVGQALVRALSALPFRLIWIDPLGQGAETAGVAPVISVLPESCVLDADPDALHLIVTHSHALDLEIAAAVLTGAFGFCGLIGSATKRALFRRKLTARGVDASRLTCPIGLAPIRGKAPAVIAASVAAQMIEVDQALAGQQCSEAS